MTITGSGERELVVLGTASQVPTRHRNHNGYLLRWDGEGILFDPGEGTQRQMLRAGVAAHDLITRICVTHFHGDHCLGLPGRHPAHQPRPACRTRSRRTTRRPASSSSTGCATPRLPRDGAADRRAPSGRGRRVSALDASAYGDARAPSRLRHPVESLRLPARRAATAAACCPSGWPRTASRGPRRRRLQRDGAETSRALRPPGRGQRAAAGPAVRLRHGHPSATRRHRARRGCDLLVIESTFLDAEAALAARPRPPHRRGRPARSRARRAYAVSC